jgi:hypothetical protein
MADIFDGYRLARAWDEMFAAPGKPRSPYDAWRFLVLGRSLERADMTARLLLARMPGPAEQSWPLLLHACGAYESFIRTHGWVAEPALVAEFLLRDRLFPRSALCTPPRSVTPRRSGPRSTRSG